MDSTLSLRSFRIAFYLSRQRLEPLANKLLMLKELKERNRENAYAITIVNQEIERLITHAFLIVVNAIISERKRKRASRDPRKY